MKRIVGIVLAGLGGFLLVLAGVLKFWAVPALAKAPLSPGDATGGITTSVNKGTFTKYFDFGTLKTLENVPVISTRTTRGDVEAAQTDEGKGLAIYDSFSNTTDDTGKTLSASTIRIAFDRVTSELKNCCGVNNDGKEVEWSGVAPLKFPFWVEQKSYDYFDTTINKPMTVNFVGEEDLFGLKVYRFEGRVEPTQIKTLEVPGALVGSKESEVTGYIMYQNDRTLWVDPVTGSIVKGSEAQKVTGRIDPAGEDKITLVEGTVGGADPEVKESVDSTKKLAGLLNMANTTVPAAAGVLGIASLVGGLLLGRRKDEDTGSYSSNDQPANV